MWIKMLNWLSQSASWLLFGVLLVALLGVIGLIVWKLTEFPVPAILLAAGASFLIAIPLVSVVNQLVEKKAEADVISEKESELESLKLAVENEYLKKEKLEKDNEILEQKLEINSLNEEINLLKACQSSLTQFEKIAEVALIKANINQTKVWHELIGDDVKKGKGIRADFYDDKILVVNTYDVDAKIGIDFNKIKVKKIDRNKIQVTGIAPLYIGSTKTVSNNHIKEIRRNNYKKNEYSEEPILVRTIIENTPDSIKEADRREREFNAEYQKSLQSMENWKFLEDAVVSLGKNFVEMVFSGLYKNIEFVEEGDDSFLHMQDYIEKELDKNDQAKTKIAEAKQSQQQ